MHCHTSIFRFLLSIPFAVFAFRLASAQPLSVSPVSFDLGRFPAWKAQAQTFTIRNTGESTVNLLRVRSSCSCLAADFRPCALEAGQETSLTVTIPANSVSGDFSKTVPLRRQIAIDWQEETLPPLEIKVRFTVVDVFAKNRLFGSEKRSSKKPKGP